MVNFEGDLLIFIRFVVVDQLQLSFTEHVNVGPLALDVIELLHLLPIDCEVDCLATPIFLYDNGVLYSLDKWLEDDGLLIIFLISVHS